MEVMGMNFQKQTLSNMADTVFENIVDIPNQDIESKSKSLIGFDDKFNRVYGNFKLMLDSEGLVDWQKKYHPNGLDIIEHISDRYPLIILEGDVGTGKTATAEALADRITRELDREGFFMKLSTRVRGEGLHGEMGNLVNDAFDELKKQAGKRRLAFLLIDEADAIATTRGTDQMHQEEKAGVNTLIQKIDELREMKGRTILMMSTNRLHFLDEAIVRRAALVIKFERPNDSERMELIQTDLKGVELREDELIKLVQLTGPENHDGVGYSYSDLRLKVFPEAVARSFPNRPISFNVLQSVIDDVEPSPVIS